MPDLIVTLPDFKAYLRHNTDADDLQLTGALTAAHDLIYDATGRLFTVPATDAVAETRYFPAPTGNVLAIDDLADTTGLVVAVEGGATIDAAGYVVEPRTRPSGWPYTTIRFTAGTVAFVPRFDLDWWWRLPTYYGTPYIAVTSAAWGWPTVPHLATEAIKIVAKNIWNYRTTAFGVATLPGDVSIMVAGDPQVDAMVKALRRANVSAPRTINVSTSL